MAQTELGELELKLLRLLNQKKKGLSMALEADLGGTSFVGVISKDKLIDTGYGEDDFSRPKEVENALNKLVEVGYVNLEEDSIARAYEVGTYTITDSGKEYLRDLGEGEEVRKGGDEGDSPPDEMRPPSMK